MTVRKGAETWQRFGLAKRIRPAMRLCDCHGWPMGLPCSRHVRGIDTPGMKAASEWDEHAVFFSLLCHRPQDIKVAGLLGPAARVEKKSPHIADAEVCMPLWKCV